MQSCVLKVISVVFYCLFLNYLGLTMATEIIHLFFKTVLLCTPLLFFAFLQVCLCDPLSLP